MCVRVCAHAHATASQTTCLEGGCLCVSVRGREGITVLPGSKVGLKNSQHGSSTKVGVVIIAGKPRSRGVRKQLCWAGQEYERDAGSAGQGTDARGMQDEPNGSRCEQGCKTSRLSRDNSWVQDNCRQSRDNAGRIEGLQVHSRRSKDNGKVARQWQDEYGFQQRDARAQQAEHGCMGVLQNARSHSQTPTCCTPPATAATGQLAMVDAVRASARPARSGLQAKKEYAI
eukprot:1149225-Pelagomonas_calceolata.AAC.2